MVNIILDEVNSLTHSMILYIRILYIRILFGDVCFFLVLIGKNKQFLHTEFTGNLFFFKIHEFVRSRKTKSLDLATQTLAQVGSTRVSKGNMQIWQQHDGKGQLARFLLPREHSDIGLSTGSVRASI